MSSDMRWALALVFSLGLLLSACPSNGDDDSGAGDDDTAADPCVAGSPVVVFNQPSNGAGFDEGEMVHIQVSVTDDHDSPTALDLVWTDKVDDVETEFYTPVPDANGVINLERDNFSVGIHIIKLTATDSDGCEGLEDTSFSVGV